MPVRAAVRRLTAVGVPVGASYLVICAANLVLMRILAPFGPSVQSGYANAATLQTLLIIPGLVLGSATAIVLNSHRGAGRSGLLSPRSMPVCGSRPGRTRCSRRSRTPGGACSPG
ncbi:hypothetical protein DDE05_28590 [Streptomyces cavourensis]|nr:hypothetical protein DDE05_28590 [Streptomyces cavourensis]